MNNHPTEFFLETRTYRGRFLLYEELCAQGPEGLTLLGKSVRACDLLLKEAEKAGLSPQRILSAARPEETAGLLIPGQKLAVYAARCIEGFLPGICERELPSRLMRETDSEEKMVLHRALSEAEAAEARTARMLRAAGELIRENEALQQSCLDRKKTELTAGRIFRREYFPKQKGREYRRFLTALTGRGFYSCGTLPLLCEKAILVDDPFGGAAEVFMAKLRELLLAAGEEFISCPDLLEPKRTAHLILPEQRICFVTVSPLLPCPALPLQRRTVHYTRFCDTDQLEPHRQKIRFIRRMAAELLREAESTAAEAVRAEELLEEYLPQTDEEELLRLARKQML